MSDEAPTTRIEIRDGVEYRVTVLPDAVRPAARTWGGKKRTPAPTRQQRQAQAKKQTKRERSL